MRFTATIGFSTENGLTAETRIMYGASPPPLLTIAPARISRKSDLMAEVRHGDGWSIREGSGPVVATAIHNGHALSRDVAELTALGEEERFREEDPYTGQFAEIVETCVVVHQSRFELDLNRPPELSVYEGPEHAWGLEVWKSPLPGAVILRSLQRRRNFYQQFEELLREKEREHGRFVVLDIHSYNHRRDGGDEPPERAVLAADLGRRSDHHVRDQPRRVGGGRDEARRPPCRAVVRLADRP
ncbi:MAG: N-formylglutamate amidohydrolase, partial [Acidobacteria bacterium]|nr:N-formylglutamate amidohydrolase [Acidobacteriota bacterium]